MKYQALGPKLQPAVRAVGAKLSKTLEETIYEFMIDGRRFRAIVEEGYLFDGASIPRLLWSPLGLSPHGAMDGPALLHDYFYNYQGKLPFGHFQELRNGAWINSSMVITRSMADGLLEAYCKHFKVGRSDQEWLVWAGVRVGGWMAWWRDDPKRKQKIIEQFIAGEINV